MKQFTLVSQGPLQDLTNCGKQLLFVVALLCLFFNVTFFPDLQLSQLPPSATSRALSRSLSPPAVWALLSSSEALLGTGPDTARQLTPGGWLPLLSTPRSYPSVLDTPPRFSNLHVGPCHSADSDSLRLGAGGGCLPSCICNKPLGHTHATVHGPLCGRAIQPDYPTIFPSWASLPPKTSRCKMTSYRHYLPSLSSSSCLEHISGEQRSNTNGSY